MKTRTDNIGWVSTSVTLALAGELEEVFKELGETDLNIYLLSGKFDNIGGFNMLSIEDWTSLADEIESLGIKSKTKAFDDYIWNNYNKPWLENALQRGDDIVVWSNPFLKENIDKFFSLDGIRGKSFYGREIDFIEQNASRYGYDFDLGINSGTFSK